MTKAQKLFTYCSVLLLVVVSGILASLPVRVHAQTGTTSLGLNSINCVVTVSTATTLQEVGGNCLAPTTTGQRLYITDIIFGANADAIAAGTFMTLETGTKVSTACDTNPAVIWQGFAPAATQQSVVQDLTTPMRLPANSELCWIDSTAGSKVLSVNGYIAQ